MEGAEVARSDIGESGQLLHCLRRGRLHTLDDPVCPVCQSTGKTQPLKRNRKESFMDQENRTAVLGIKPEKWPGEDSQGPVVSIMRSAKLDHTRWVR
jgi:hypothetical protein